MYIYVSRTGLIKEVVNDVALRQANDNINHIYLYCEGLPIADASMGMIRYKLPNGVLTPEIQFSLVTVKKEIPYDKHRDMKYFKDYEEYDFYDIAIPDGSDPLIPNVLGETGLVEFTARFVDSANQTIYAIQTATFYVEASVVKKTEFITGDQYNYLLKLITYISSDVVANPLGDPTGNLYTIKIGDVIYKVSVDSYLKEINVTEGTHKKTYKIKDNLDNETDIVSPINWLVSVVLSSGGYVTIKNSDDSDIQFQIPNDNYVANVEIEGNELVLTKKGGDVIRFAGSGGGAVITDYCNNATYDATTHVLTLTFADGRSPTVVPVPYLTSQLANDSGFIGSAALSNYYLKTEIDNLPISHFTNDEQYITVNVNNLTNYTKTNDLSAVALSGRYADVIGTPQIADNLTTDDATKILSAKQGYEINNRLKAVEGLGRFLSVWNADDGYPDDLPPADQLPYELHNGDYYIVGDIASGGANNYKPHVTIIDGKGYFIDAVSTDVESTELHTKDLYIYDGANKVFKLISDSSAEVYWANIKGNDPMINTYLAALFNAKQDKLTDSVEISIVGGVLTWTNPGYIKYTDLGVESGSHLSYNSSTGKFGVNANYVIPSETKIAEIDENAEDIANLAEDLNDKQDKSDDALSTTDKTVVGAINEIDAAVKGLDFSSYQTKKDSAIYVPTDETEKTVVGTLNWLYDNKMIKNPSEGILTTSDFYVMVDRYGNPKKISPGQLTHSAVGEMFISHTATTEYDVLSARGGIYWEKISDFDDIGYYVWLRTDVLPTYNVTMTSSTIHLRESTVPTWNTEYRNWLDINDGVTGSLPENIVIKVNGVVIQRDTQYYYNKTDGRFYIYSYDVRGDIEIIAEVE